MKSKNRLRPVASLTASLVAIASFLCASQALADETSAPEKTDVDDMLRIGVPEQIQATDAKPNDPLPRVLLLGGFDRGGLCGLRQLAVERQGICAARQQRRPLDRGIEQYAARLDQLVVRLKKTNAKLIWATTTPWCPEPYEYAKNRLKVILQYSAEDEKRWKDAALEVMKKHDIPVNDLHALLLPDLNDYLNRPDDIHFNAKGSQTMAGQIAAVIGKSLKLDAGNEP